MKRLHSVILLVLVSLALAACPGKRPPVVATTTGGAGSAGPAATGGGSGSQAVDEGPDIQAVDPGGLGEAPLSDEFGEGGPLADIHFDYDQASLTDETRATLQKHADWIRAHPGLRITIEGHCDERGTVEYNLALGDQRGRAARDYLVSLGVDQGRLADVSYGKERPLDPGTGEVAWSRNRRAHFVVSR